SELEREPEQKSLGEVAQQPRLARQEADRSGPLALDPVGKARDVARLVERDHQLVVEKEAAQVEVGRAGERELIVDDDRLRVQHRWREPEARTGGGEVAQRPMPGDVGEAMVRSP